MSKDGKTDLKGSVKIQYQMFNPSTGVHTAYETLEGLRAAREILVQAELEKIRSRYRILEEKIYANGDSETRPFFENQPEQDKNRKEIHLSYAHAVPVQQEIHPLAKKTEVI